METILIIEDEKNLLENLELILQSEGYNVITAVNGLDALDKLETVIPDLIISDIMMPVMNGYDLFDKVKKDAKTYLIPFIFLTAKSDLSSVRQGMNLGADDYLTKPFLASDLISSIKARLEKSRLHKKKLEVIKDSISLYVPHELRTPLVSILGYTEIILAENDSLGKSEILEMVDRIHYSAKRLRNRIEKFLQLSGIHLTELEEKGTSLCPTIEKDFFENIVIENISTQKRITSFMFDLEPARVKISAAHLKVVTNELFENAVKFSTPETEIRVTGKRNTDSYTLEVFDSGIGMTKEEINTIDIFNQFNRNILQQEGNGFGLAIIKRILLIYGGSLKVESKKNQYTKVTLQLPLCS